jgi:hypothetical protein
MNSKLNALCLGASLALGSFLATPAMADEWNKRTELQFSGPVEIPGRVLLAGKYVFELAESNSDRNIVEIFSEDSKGRENLVATILATPDYMTNTPDKTIIQFEERGAGAPEAIHSWFYPGDNFGWQFVYPKAHTLTSANTMPASAPAAPADTPSLPPSPQVQDTSQPSDETAVEEEALVAQNDVPPPPAAQNTDTQASANDTLPAVLPETGGYSALAFLDGFTMLVAGALVTFAALRKVQA